MRTILLLSVLTVASAPLVAQEDVAREKNERRGGWFSFGVGPGSTSLTCSTCNTDRWNHSSFSLRFGGTLSQRFLLGGDLSGWSITLNNVHQTIGAGTVSLTWYPARRGAFWLRAGLGIMTYQREDTNNRIEATEEVGVASLGLGYDIRVLRWVSIVPFAHGFAGKDVKRFENGLPVIGPADLARDLYQVGVGITLH